MIFINQSRTILKIALVSVWVSLVFLSLLVPKITLADEAGFITPADEAAFESASFNEDVLVSEAELSAQSGQGGGAKSAVSVANLSNNVINIGPGGTLNNGNNTISDGAFANSSGIATVIQNSGNNVLIQDNTVVNVTFGN